jgi:rubrerythrin
MHEVEVKRDFALLSPQEALRIAIVIEERNTQLYHRLGEMFSKFCPDSPQIVSTFYDLADTERQHGVLLTAEYCERFGGVQVDVTEEDIRDLIEMPGLRAGDILDATEAGDGALARRMALEMALATECSTVNYYGRLVETTPDPELKDLYTTFVAFEQEHTSELERALGQLGHS